jgi:hypothetical protein
MDPDLEKTESSMQGGVEDPGSIRTPVRKVGIYDPIFMSRIESGRLIMPLKSRAAT